MPQPIDTKMTSLKVQKPLNTTQEKLTTSKQGIGSSLGANSGRNDAAGPTIAERVNSQMHGMNIGNRNANDGISLAHGRIKDADFAAETAIKTRSQIMQQADNAMRSQANLIPQSVAKLLG